VQVNKPSVIFVDEIDALATRYGCVFEQNNNLINISIGVCVYYFFDKQKNFMKEILCPVLSLVQWGLFELTS
jgi:phosphatidylglycerophosphatase A